MPEPRWKLFAITTRMKRKFSAMRNRYYAQSVKPRDIPEDFVQLPETNHVGSFDIGQRLKTGTLHHHGNEITAIDGSIWSIVSPAKEFTDELHDFTWLDHLAAVGDPASRKQAQRWLHGWIDRFGNGYGPGWTPQITGKRLSRICIHGNFLQRGMNHSQKEDMFISIARQIEYLRKTWRYELAGLPKLYALVGMATAGAYFERFDRYLMTANRALGAEAASYIDSDGEIPTRNPEELMEFFASLTSIHKTLSEADKLPDGRILNAMERIAPVLRNLRLGGGNLVRFHGGGRGREGFLDQVLSDSEVRRGRPTLSAMGYDRMTAGRTILVIDGASPPDLAHSANAHASTFAFEMSSSWHPIVVNCGAGQKFGPEWKQVCRKTGAHNTLVIDGTSSAKIDVDGLVSNVFGKRIVTSPRILSRSRDSDHLGSWLLMNHDGYAKQFGTLHQRRFFLSRDGKEFRGQDTLIPADSIFRTRNSDGVVYDIHFHLHPDISVKTAKDGNTIALQLPNKEIWAFRQSGGTMAVKNSVFIDQLHLEPRATKQIVVSGEILEYAGQITWIFKRVRNAERTLPPVPEETEQPVS